MNGLWLLASKTVPAPSSSPRGEAGPIALLVIVLLLIATVLLIRNMGSRLRRIPPEFPAEREARLAREARAQAEATDAPAGDEPDRGDA